MGYLLVCLVFVLYVSEVSGQFMSYYQDYRSQQKLMDEGLEYIRESPSYAFNTFSQKYYPQRTQQIYNYPQRRTNNFDMFGGLGTVSNYNSLGGGLSTQKGFIDEGFEHVRERGTIGDMRSIMSNPSLFLSALLA